MNIIFIGAGGHAKVVYDVICSGQAGLKFHFIDENIDTFFDAKKITDAELEKIGDDTDLVIGIGGVTPLALEKRLHIFRRYHHAGYQFPVCLHQNTDLSASAVLADGVIVCPRVVINAHANIGSCAIINTGAIVEHDVTIGSGAHICPGAIVLGGATVGENALIGAGAVVLPYAQVLPNTLVPACTRFPVKSSMVK